MDDQDHRAIANRMDLWHQQEEAAGMVFWHPRGFALFRIVEDTIRARMRGLGFREIRTPMLLDRKLWEQSGHWEKFGDNMFAFDDGDQSRALKPMSCPGHVQVFNKRVRSFRDLPIRYCEFGLCHRDEPSGALLGLMRGRSFVQDDAHIFCAEDHVARFCGLLHKVYADFGFDDVQVAFSTRPESDAAWDAAEARLEAAAQAAGLAYCVDAGGGAFYGPKLDFHLRDNRGRAWQCGTVQLDMVLPERLNAAYIDAGGARLRPVMIHHAVLGSVERLIGMLLEHHEGNLPLWLALDQIVVASITDAQVAYAKSVVDQLVAAGYRAVADVRPERLARKVVDAREAGIPLLAAVGAREAVSDQITLRRREGTQEALTVAAAIAALRDAAFR